MKTRLLNIWEFIHTSFWFVPGLMVSAAIALAAGMLSLDGNINVQDWPWSRYLHFATPEGSREVLSTIAASMITVAGVVFSITIVALTLASSQFGPHLLRTFIRNTGNQIVLGTFISTYVYCLLVLRSIQSETDAVFVPSLAMSLAIGLAIINVGVLIYFIHHVSVSLQANTVIADVYDELMMRMRKQFPKSVDEEAPPDEEPLTVLKTRYAKTTNLCSCEEGYLQAVDFQSLFEAAEKLDCLLHLQVRAGKPVERGRVLCLAYADRWLTKKEEAHLTRHFILGSQPTPEQDVEFAVRQLVQIAVRALSPGVNDPFTAITCVDYLGFAMAFLTSRADAHEIERDKAGTPRLILQVTRFSGVMDAAFDQIRQSAESNVSVSIRLLETFVTIAQHCQTGGQRECVEKHGAMVFDAICAKVNNENDRKDLQARFESLNVCLRGEQARGHCAI